MRSTAASLITYPTNTFQLLTELVQKGVGIYGKKAQKSGWEMMENKDNDRHLLSHSGNFDKRQSEGGWHKSKKQNQL